MAGNTVYDYNELKDKLVNLEDLSAAMEYVLAVVDERFDELTVFSGSYTV